MPELINNGIIETLARFLPKPLATKLTEIGPLRYFFHTGWNLAGKVINLIVSFFVSIYVVRYFGPENWGLLSYVVSFTGIFSFLASLGVDSILYVDLIKSPQDRDSLMGSAFLLKLFGGITAFVLVLIFSILSRNNFYTNILMAVVASAFFFQPFNVINLYFQANVQAKPVVLLSLISSISLSALKILFVFMHLSIKYFALLYLAEVVLLAIGYIYIYYKANLNIFNWKRSWVLSKTMLKVSWPLIVSSAFAYIYTRIDQVMLKQMLGQTSVGLYDTGVRLAEAWYVFPSIIIGSMFPAIINAKKTNFQMFENRLVKLYRYTVYLALLFIVPISFLAPFIIQILYGESFAQSADVLKIYVWAGISVTLATVINQYLISEKLTTTALFLNFFGMASNILINLYAIPKYGMSGAAWATLISYSLIPFGIIFFKSARGQLKYIYRALLWMF